MSPMTIYMTCARICFAMLLMLSGMVWANEKETSTSPTAMAKQGTTQAVAETVVSTEDDAISDRLIFSRGLPKDKRRELSRRFKYDDKTGLLRIADQKGRFKKSIQFQKHIEKNQRPPYITISDNGEYICASTLRFGKARDEEEAEKGGRPLEGSEVSVWNKDGKKLWSVTGAKLGYAFVSSNGKCVVGREFGWHRSPVRMIKSGLNVQLLNWRDYDGAYEVAFDPKGEGLGIAYTTFVRKKGLKTKTAIIADYYSSDGKRLWRRKELGGCEKGYLVETRHLDDVFVLTLICRERGKIDIWLNRKNGEVVKKGVE